MNGFQESGTLLCKTVLVCAATAGLALAARPHDLRAQMPPGVERDPMAARIAFDDLDRFGAAYRRLPASPDTAALLDTAYLAHATVGLATYARLYDVSPTSLARAIAATPGRFRRTALEAPVAVRALEVPVRAAFRRLADLYPGALFPPVFFLVGRDHAGGAVQREGVLIAVETYVESTGRSYAGLVSLVAHELAHYQQAAHDPEAYQRSSSLLARAIKEGAADYVAELLTGAHINEEAHAYGNDNEWTLWSRFRCVMNQSDTGDWFFRRPRNPDWPQDLGYFVGYRIAALRHAREAAPRPALAALLQVDDYAAFLNDSGYESYLEEREGRPFPACH